MTHTGGVRRTVPLLLLAVLASACTGRSGAPLPGSGPQQNSVPGLTAGVFPADDREPAPALKGRTLEGSELDVADLRGKIVVVNFWGSWCAPCLAEARNLNAVYAATKASGVEFVGIDLRDDTVKAQAFQRAKQVQYPSIYDQKGLLLLKFRDQAPQQPPTTIVLDRRGRVAARFIGGVTETQLLVPVQVLAKEPA